MGVNVPNMDQRCLSWDFDQSISNQHLGTLDAKLFGIQPYDHGAKSLASLKSEQENPDLYFWVPHMGLSWFSLQISGPEINRRTLSW
jgi:hypothetical protein